MKQICIQYFQREFLDLILGSYEGKLCLADSRNRKNRETIDNRIKKALKADFIERDDKVLQKTKKQLEEYLKGQRKEFDIPRLMVGTDFQKSVWDSLCKIPYGETATYLQQAKAIGKEKAVRAVANGNGANAMAIIIPCHRIIGSDGTLTGYAGGVDIKKQLLDLESKNR